MLIQKSATPLEYGHFSPSDSQAESLHLDANLLELSHSTKYSVRMTFLCRKFYGNLRLKYIMSPKQMAKEKS